MVSNIEICNMALQDIGAKKISDLNENTKNAIECKLRYDTVRLALLESYLWNFATKRAQLTSLESSPEWGYSNELGLPGDFVRMVATEDQLEGGLQLGLAASGIITLQFNGGLSFGDDYHIEAKTDGVKVLRCNDASKNILYIFNQQNTAQFAPMFVELFAGELGLKIGTRIEANASLLDRLEERVEKMRLSAQMVDSAQGTPKVIRRSALLQIKRGW